MTDDMGRPVDHIAAGMDGRVRASPEAPAWALGQLWTAEQGPRAVTIDAAWALSDAEPADATSGRARWATSRS